MYKVQNEFSIYNYTSPCVHYNDKRPHPVLVLIEGIDKREKTEDLGALEDI